MSGPSGSYVSPSSPRAPQVSTSAWIGLLIAGLVCAVTFNSGLPSSSTDISMHYALTQVIYEHGGRYAPRLWKFFDAYPPLAHWLAATAGKLAGTPMRGMLSVGAFMTGALYFVIVYLAARTSVFAAGAAALALVALLFLQIDQHALHGFELVTDFFFAHLVGIGLCWIALLSLWPLLEEGPSARVTVWTALLTAVIAAAHLMPALQFAGAVVLLMLLRTLRTKQWLGFGVLCAVVGGVLLIHPSTRIMIFASTNNGVVSISALAASSLPFVAALGAVMGAAVLRIGFRRQAEPIGGGDVIAAMTIVTALLCLLQAIALRLGFGSEYAVVKYASSVFTLTIVVAATLGGGWLKSAPAAPALSATFASMVAVLVASLILPQPHLSTAAYDELADYARRSVGLLGDHAEQKTVVLVRSLPPVASFLVTAADMGNTKISKSYALLVGHLPRQEGLRYAVVDAGDPLFPKACDVDVPAGRYRVVDLACAKPSMNRLAEGIPMRFSAGGEGGYALREGWGSAYDSDGVWSSGPKSVVALRVPPTRGASLAIDAAALLDASRPALPTAFSAAGNTQEHVFDLAAGRATIRLPLPDADVEREIELEVRVLGKPDALPYTIRLYSITLTRGSLK